ncbi:MAG: UDP-N-acetylmuramate--L-alanine ligase [Gammaproteobacteria bacterium]
MTILEEIKNKQRVQHIHFIGVGGAGMSGIAEVLLNEGYKISGSDLNDSASLKRLKQFGAEVYVGHDACHIHEPDIVVTSTAIEPNNPELKAALEKRIPVVPRAQMLAEIMRTRHGIAIAGTHGKTTTTSLVTSVLTEAELDPTFVIGGCLNAAGCNARLGTSNFLVAEADESDASFLFLKPQIAVVTNIDEDHTWSYEYDFNKVKKTFIEFLHHLPMNGLAVVCIDDPVVRELLPIIGRPMLTYGFSEDADVRATNFRQEGTQSFFTAILPNNEHWEIKLNLPGKHNVCNALAAIAIAHELKISQEATAKALEVFKGVGRRFQIRGEFNFGQGNALVVDDYGHHPREMMVTIEAIRQAWPERRLVMAFQPHRYSRTKALFDDFARVLSEVDSLFLLEIYSAGEEPIKGIDGRNLCRAIRERGRVEPIYVGRDDKFVDFISPVLADGDILLLQGAGDIGGIAASIPVNPV